MNKEINCRLVDGKPKISFNTSKTSTPKKGDIMMGCFNNEKYFMWIEGSPWGNNQAYVELFVLATNESLKLIKGVSKIQGVGEWESWEAGPEEKEVMLYLLEKNELELVDGEVRKKHWTPKNKEPFWLIGVPGPLSQEECRYICKRYTTTDGTLPRGVFKCYKTEEACQKVVDQLNEITIKSEQE